MRWFQSTRIHCLLICRSTRTVLIFWKWVCSWATIPAEFLPILGKYKLPSKNHWSISWKLIFRPMQPISWLLQLMRLLSDPWIYVSFLSSVSKGFWLIFSFFSKHRSDVFRHLLYLYRSEILKYYFRCNYESETLIFTRGWDVYPFQSQEDFAVLYWPDLVQ